MSVRPIVLATLLVGLTAWGVFHETAPSWGWTFVDRTAPGWSREEFATLDREIAKQRPTALVVEQYGAVVAEWGAVTRKVPVYSLRKSFLSALYGIAVEEERISLDSTLADLGIDDVAPSLTAAEKLATVRDLLGARSGVYHPAAGETPDMKAARPLRGSHAPGTFWYYNNFDFNALGTIYRAATGENVVDAFARVIAEPLGMEFRPRDAEFLLEPLSEHPIPVMKLSARDLVRFGRLYLDRGSWQGRQIVPAEWVRLSTRRVSDTPGGMGYGYMWWTPPPGAGLPDSTFLGFGRGGQVVAIVPERRLVVTQTVDLSDNPSGVDPGAFIPVLAAIVAAGT